MPNKPRAKRADPLALADLQSLLMSLEFDSSWPTEEASQRIEIFIDKLLRHEPWRKYLSRSHVSSIIHQRTLTAIEAESGNDDEPIDGPLKDLLKAGQLDALARELRTYLLSIPRAYHLWVKFPAMPLWGAGEIRLGDRLSLIEIDDVSIPNAVQAMHESLDQPDKVPTVYLRIACNGYGNWESDTSAVASGISTLKQFLQLCAPAGIIRRVFSRRFVIDVGSGGEPFAFVEDIKTGEVNRLHLPNVISKVVERTTIIRGKLKHSSGAKVQNSAPREEKVRALEEALQGEAGLIVTLAIAPEMTRIASALEWAFDASETENETLAFLQACIGLEALLGDDTRRDAVTERLADRCAYLLGRTEASRVRVREQFKEVYDARSKIVHGRASRLGPDEEKNLGVAKRLLSNAVWQEIRNLEDSSEPRQGF